MREMVVNVFGMASMIQGFAPILAKNGGGAIVKLLSVVSWFTHPCSTLLMQPRNMMATSTGLVISLFKLKAGQRSDFHTF